MEIEPVTKINIYATEIEKRLGQIGQLIEVPNLIINLAVSNLKALSSTDLKNTGVMKIKNSIAALENISDISIQASYKIIYNQVCVLSVSALAAVLEKYFINFVNAHWNKIDFSEEATRVSFGELAKYNFQIKAKLGSILMEKINSINFQDLQSTLRSFEKFCGKKINLEDEMRGKIIFYQQCRHVFLHGNGLVDKDFLKHVDGYNLKKFKLGDKIELEPSDWDNITTVFSELVKIIVTQKSAFDY